MKSQKPEKRLVLKGKKLLEKSGLENIHQITLRARISAQTGYKYLQTPGEVHAVDTKVLTAILIEGIGLTEKEILEMKIGDLFEFVEE